MSAPKFGRLQKASALVPLALLSTAWTASLAGAGASTAAAEDDSRTLPDGTSIPTEAIEAPASMSRPGVTSPGMNGDTKTIVANASTMGIPAAALAAYQRAETVINTADKSCNIPWQLVAAIGRVESDHGRANGNSLNSDGLATPGIFGIALDGSNGTARIMDSDAGLYDSDAKFDRAVGPMQFIPSTWRVVGVDADGDAERNPQDIDDAALATAVYLCSGDDDLSTEAGQRASVFRYNHSQSYVDLVLSIMEAYSSGDYTSVPNGTTSSAGYFVPDPTPPAPAGGKGNGQGGPAGGGSTSAPVSTGTGGGTGGGSTPSGTGGGTGGGTTEPVETPQAPEGGGGPVPNVPAPSPANDPVPTVLTHAEALKKCIAQGVVDNPLTQANELDQCVANLLN
ncbi:lytic transglycosylase domain-containing protein [Nocardioides sp.]|uniref:lytic transglycosylase domain-containing protein n=1 Tax=Nocardioides sp. TaxID=35761 RepID=UPI002D7E22D4|nr:lytic transglycosylase domain-containing protein [Nocardioides sp.]HET8961813.1 lytic transglycosylase domain-containing protein [Nocardioides sp.]